MKKGNYHETADRENSARRMLRNGGLILGAALTVFLICAAVLRQNTPSEPTDPSQNDEAAENNEFEKLDRQTRVIDVSGRFYESTVGSDDKAIDFGSFNPNYMDLIDVIPPSAINDSPEERRRDGDFEGYIKPNTSHKVRILVDNKSTVDVENVQVLATFCWVEQTRLRLIAQIFYGDDSIVEYAEDFWVNDDSESWQIESGKVTVVSVADGTPIDVPKGRYWVGDQPIPVSSDGSGLLLVGSENACFVEYTLRVVPLDDNPL